jgi:hypothetical protein
MNKIKRVSKIFSLLFQAVFIVFLLSNIIGWIIAPTPIVYLEKMGFTFTVIPKYIPILHDLSAQEKVYGFLVSIIPLAIDLWLIANLVKLFKLYQQGKIFLLENVCAIKRIGIALLLSQIVAPFYEAAISAVLTWHNPPGHRVSMASFDGTNVGLLIAAIIILLVSWVMAEACKLQHENEMTV